MIPILFVTVLSADPHDEIHKQLDSIEKQLTVLERLQNQLKAATNFKDPNFEVKHGTEKKDIYLSGIDTQRTIEYNNKIAVKKLIKSSKEIKDLEEAYVINSRAPILHFKARTPTFANEIKVFLSEEKSCNIRQAIFTFSNQSEITYKTNAVDFDNKSGFSNVIKLNTEVAFTDLEVDIPLNWGADETCLPDITVTGPNHEI